MQSRPSLSLVSARSQRIAQHDLARHLVEWEHLGYEIEERPLEHVRRAAGTRVSAPPLTHTSASRRLRSTSAERRSGRRASRSAASIWASRVWSAMSTSSTDAGAAGAGTAAPKPGPVAPTTAAMPFYMHAGTRHLGFWSSVEVLLLLNSFFEPWGSEQQLQSRTRGQRGREQHWFINGGGSNEELALETRSGGLQCKRSRAFRALHATHHASAQRFCGHIDHDQRNLPSTSPTARA